MQAVLTEVARDLARQHGLRETNAKLGGAGLAQTLVFGFLAHPEGSLQDLAQMAAVVAKPVSPQAIDERFTQHTALYFQALLEAVVKKVVRANRPATQKILQRFTEVSLQDSTTISLPEVLEEHFRGCRGSTADAGRAAVKFQVRFDLLHGGLEGLRIEEGRQSDYSTPLQTADIHPGSLHIRDLGYFDLEVLETIAQEAWFLSRLHDQTMVLDLEGNPLDLTQRLRRCRAASLELPVRLGAQHQLRCRLVAVRVPRDMAERRRRDLKRRAQKKGYRPTAQKQALCHWNIYVTNAPQRLLSTEDVVALARIRWQIELLFKLWKSDGRLAHSRSRKPWRILCEIFAKMIAMVLQHWILVTTCWQHVDRSLRRAAKAVRRWAAPLAASLNNLRELHRAIRQISASLRCAGRIDRRRKRPNAHQLLEHPKQYGYKNLNPA
jgi:hypothetical protein